ncbi:MAG: S8 family peptidase, partial [Nannocystaceae bacterium]
CVQVCPVNAIKLAELDDEALVEGTEPELVYSLPLEAQSATQGPLNAPRPAKPDRPRFVPDDPMFPLQWHLDAINAPEAWTVTRGEGTIVAVIDTGVAYKNLDWEGVEVRAVPDLAGIEFVDGETFMDKSLPEGLDDHAHGTHVAGTIAQATDNGLGVAGVAHGAKIMPLKVLGSTGGGTVPGIAAAIRYAADKGAHVINMSLGGPLPSRVMAKAVEYAHEQGTTVICAAGNEKRARVSYPAAYDGAVAVAATDFSGGRSFYSNWGKALDISAPGGDMRDDKNGDGHPDGVLQNTIKIQQPSENDYLWFQGTSMASPHAAGVAALIASEGVTNPTEVERILKETAVHPNKVEWDKNFGAGIIDAHAAVLAAKGADYRAERGVLALLISALSLLGLAGAAHGRPLRALIVTGSAAACGGAAGTAAPYALAHATGMSAAGLALALSALVPLALVLIGMQRTRLRPWLIGLSAGWAAVCLHGAVVLPTVLTAIPGGVAWDRAFLLVNAIVCVTLARRVASLSRR